MANADSSKSRDNYCNNVAYDSSFLPKRTKARWKKALHQTSSLTFSAGGSDINNKIAIADDDINNNNNVIPIICDNNMVAETESFLAMKSGLYCNATSSASTKR